jgi:hypothetical protein
VSRLLMAARPSSMQMQPSLRWPRRGTELAAGTVIILTATCFSPHAELAKPDRNDVVLPIEGSSAPLGVVEAAPARRVTNREYAGEIDESHRSEFSAPVGLKLDSSGRIDPPPVLGLARPEPKDSSPISLSVEKAGNLVGTHLAVRTRFGDRRAPATVTIR